MMRKTKIICTMGPATDDLNVVKRMIEAGMNVARFNFSHGDHAEHLERMNIVRQARKELHKPLALLLDTRGPEIRTGVYSCGKIDIQDGQDFTLTTRDIEGDQSIVSINYMGLPADVKPGTEILIDDGLVAFEVKSVEGTEIHCVAKNNGVLSGRKSVNVPGLKLNMPYLSPKDEADLIFGCEQQVNYVAASFCRSAQDMKELRAVLNAHGGEKIQIIAKIENMEGVQNIEEILDEVDGIMVARGDLGVEVPFECLPIIQKELIKATVHHGKFAVTATQMLDSMAKNPRPTRAEVSDVANAVFDGTSAIMLSGETSVGKYPVETVATMSAIAQNAEGHINYEARRRNRNEFMDMELVGDPKTNAIALAVCTTAEALDAKCIVAFTDSGSTARAISGRRAVKMIVGATPNEARYHSMSINWGVQPSLVSKVNSSTELYTQAVRAAVETAGADVGDIIIVTAGMPVGHVNYTNTMRVIEITADMLALAFEENV